MQLRPASPTGWRQRGRALMAHAQHRDSAALLFNTGATAAAGLLFWVVLTRALDMPAADVGIGYAMVALGSTIALLGKGGLDTALVRHGAATSRREAGRLLGYAACIAGLAIAALVAAAAAAAREGGALQHWSLVGWFLIGAVAVLLAINWLQDATFLAAGHARLSALRNLGGSLVRIILPLLLVTLATPFPIALSWAIALAGSAVLGLAFLRILPDRTGPPVASSRFLASAARNLPGGAAEFLPGLLLTPIVLAIDGPAAAAYFGMAWSMASLLFLGASAIGRSALAELARPGVAASAAMRRAILQVVVIIAPAAAVGMAFAPQLLAIFGPAYAREGALAFAILCASVFVVAPAALYLAVLRAREQTVPLLVAPLLSIGALLAAAPILQARAGLAGVAVAWLLANAPFGAWSAWRLHREAREVTNDADATPVDGRAHVE